MLYRSGEMSTINLKTTLIIITTIHFCIQGFLSAQTPAIKYSDTITEIRTEALRSNSDTIGRPLPLAAHWSGGEILGLVNIPGTYFTPAYQVQLILDGHHFLPLFGQRKPLGPDTLYDSYYEEAIKQLAEWNLPFTIMGSQWERLLSERDEYWLLPDDQNPNVLNINGEFERRVSPFGAKGQWYEVGKTWTTQRVISKLQQWYPNPPMVMMLSNNEHDRLEWHEAEISQRYIDLYGTGMGDDFKRQVFTNGWIEKYTAIQDGMTEGLSNPVWQNNVFYVGYNVGDVKHFARWNFWKNYSLYTPGRIDPGHLYWDGGSPSYYLNQWQTNLADFKVYSPQVEFMNIVFILEEAYSDKPEFWYEMSVWDGFDYLYPNDPEKNKRAWYESIGQEFSAYRYKGYVQFGMWLTRPRVVREYRHFREPQEDVGLEYFQKLMESVDRIYKDSLLEKFWRKGNLVRNNSHKHPYQSDVPPEYSDTERWYLLDTNLDPPRPWDLATEIPVFSLALCIGSEPSREWLVYAYSPVEDRTDVTITIPLKDTPITVDVPVEGAFYYIIEDSVIVSVESSIPVAQQLELSQNYPNPFNPFTSISYRTPENSEVMLYVYDVIGRKVATLVNQSQAAGSYTVQWNGTYDNGSPVGTGVYFTKIQAGDYSEVIKMVYLR